MAVQHEINEILDTIRKELPRRVHSNYEDAVKRAMHQRDRRQHQFARGMLRHNPMLRREWNRQQEEEGALAIFMLIIGLIGGAALMYLFDPERGARRRAAFQIEMRHFTENASETVERVRDEVSKVAGETEDKAEQLGDDARAATNNSVKNSTSTTSDQVKRTVSNTTNTVRDTAARSSDQLKTTARKAASEVETPIHNVANDALKALVRAEVMRDVKNPSEIEITVENGMVTLMGTIGANEVQALVEKVQAVPGVTSVDNRLEVHDATPGTARPPSASVS
jgi:osmotically-inducible protein OsmY